MDELSCCINQLEAEVNSSARHRSVRCNGEAGDGDRSSSGSSHSGAIIGCMKCHRDNAYEQVTCLHPYTLNSVVLYVSNVTCYTLVPYLVKDD